MREIFGIEKDLGINKLIFFKKIHLISLLLLAILLCGITKAYAQEILISGIVSDTDKQPVVGAVVLVKGTTINTVTGNDGSYHINVADTKGTLVFSLLGFVTKEQEIGSSKVVNVTLKENVVSLSDVVVVGYGSQIRRELTGSISKIEAKEIQKSLNNTFESSLQGRVSGVQIVQSSGAAGSGPMVRVRGIGTSMGSAQPLYVVDGVPIISEAGDDAFSNYRGIAVSPLSNINSNDIESIEVLKDAYAGAIYGARAANGVIIVTTKKGKSGGSKVDVESTLGYLSTPLRVKFLGADDWRALRKEAWVNTYGTKRKGPPTPSIDYGDTYMDTATYNHTNVNYMDQFLQIGKVYGASVTASGGNDKSQYLLSGTYKKEDGVQTGDSYDNVNFRLNLQNQANNWLLLGINSNLNLGNIEGNAAGTTWITMHGKEQGVHNLSGGWSTAVTNGVPVIPIYDPKNTNEYYNLNDFRGNVIAAADKNIRTMTNENLRILGNAFAVISFNKNLNFRSSLGMDNYNSISQIWRSGKINSSGLSYAEDARYTSRNMTFDNYFTFNYDKDSNYALDAVLGSSIQRSTTLGNAAAGRNMSSDQLHLVSQASEMIYTGSTKGDYAFNSYFFRSNIKLFSKYLIGISTRYDGSSRFGVNNRYGFFPAASAGWLISEEDFMKSIQFISFLKIRSSYGLTGNAGTGNYDYMATYSTTDEYAVQTYNGYPAITPYKQPSDNLKWEKCYQFDIGLEFGFFDNRINGTLGFYNKETNGMFSNYGGPPSMGFENNNVIYNTGSMQNKGIEFDLNASVVSKKKFKWNANFIISHNENKIISWGELEAQRIGAAIKGEDNIVSQPNESMGLFYISEYAFVDKETGEMHIYEFADVNGTPLYNPDGTRATISIQDYTKWELIDAESAPDKAARLCPDGNPRYFRRVFSEKPTQPKFVGGITNNFEFFGFDLSVLFSFSYGNYMYDSGEGMMNNPNFEYMNMRNTLLKRWQQPGDITDVPKLLWNEGVEQTYSKSRNFDWGTPFVSNSRFLFDASYIRLQTVSLGYTFNSSWLQKKNISKLRLYATGQNLLLMTKFPGWEVESFDGAGSGYWGNFRANAFASGNLPIPRTVVFGLQISL
jgi:TonB-dependent starch-binding outer membrane protein SusC